MKANEFILSKQIQWAYRNSKILIGSKGNRGRKAYTNKLDDNLFGPLMPKVENEFRNADGGELTGNPCKMQAVHSSSALGVNIFQYWKKIKQCHAIAAACKFCNFGNNSSKDINFEVKCQINGKFSNSPNIDVVIRNSPKSKFEVFAIECKFSEAYSLRTHSGISHKYIGLDKAWHDIPNLLELAKTISPDDKSFAHLHVAQLIKHILGLKENFGKKKFRLLYLWYDTIGPESAIHHKEIEKFTKVTKADSIYFHAMSYQELIANLSKKYRGTHKDYIDYISGRYL